jgi:sulfoxide reductase heme-binding subunit YedZ
VKSDPTFWLLARATGIVAYVLLTVSVLAGLLVKSRPFGTKIKPAVAVDMHRTLVLLSLTALAGHGLALVLDHTVEIALLDLLVPGTAPYRPFWTGLGVLAGELMLIVYLSFGLRKRIGVRNWRRLHWTTYGAFAGATAHGLMAGTDSGAPWALAMYFGAVGAVVAASAWRALVPPPTPARPKPRPARSEPGRPHRRPATSEGAS